EVGLGGSGMDTRAIRENQPVDGSRRSALEELADWTVSPAAVHLNEHQNVPVSAKHCELLCLDLAVAERLRKRRLEPALAEVVAGKARALSDPTRLTLAAARLETDELCVCDLAWIAERSQTLVSHHVRVLRTHGLVRSRREGKMVMYSLTEEGRVLLASVLTEPTAARTSAAHA